MVCAAVDSVSSSPVPAAKDYFIGTKKNRPTGGKAYLLTGMLLQLVLYPSLP